MPINKQKIGDLVLLENISDDEINQVLKSRYSKDDIYTFIGPVLISINPFKTIKKIYSDDTVNKYKNSCYWENDPHIFALSEDVFKSLRETESSQCIIISGESGAGKTEAAKLVLKYISDVSKHSKELDTVKEKLIATNPILESFGNAKTIRNENSSRFGKYFEIIFDFDGNPIGGRINNYLLEKIRVINPMDGERGFHIFYQLLTGVTSSSEKEKLHLRPPEFFAFLKKSKELRIAAKDDRTEYDETKRAMLISGFGEEEIFEIWRVVAAILWLGEVEFSQGTASEQAIVTQSEAVTVVAELLSLPPGLLEETLTSREFIVNDKITKTHLNKSQAIHTRDSLCTDMYSKLFDYLVKKINLTIDPRLMAASSKYFDATGHMLIGVLDIYGFEIFEHNSFEQFCINYVNEKLQQIFIERTLRAEQADYEREQIQWTPVAFFNNKVVCDLVESTPRGLLAYLDEESIVPSGSDAGFLRKIGDAFKGHEHFAAAESSAFTVRHYAGDVRYEAAGFVEKNKNLVWRDLLLLGQKSGLETLNRVYEGYAEVFSKKRPASQGRQFKAQIFSLAESLNACVPHYIRCIKPNDNKRADEYNEPRVLHQIQYLGLKENVRVRRAGFAFRMEYGHFYKRYRVVAAATWPTSSEPMVQTTKIILSEIKAAEHKEYELGKTKVFIKDPQDVFRLDEARNEAMGRVFTKVQAMVRGYSARLLFYYSKAAKILQQHIKVCLKIKHAEKAKKAAGDVFSGKKLRRAFSAELWPVGDYLNFESNAKFTGKNFRPDRITKINGFRSFDLSTVEHLLMSKNPDNLIAIKMRNSHAVVIITERKTELAILLKEKSSGVEIIIAEDVKATIKAKRTQTYVFKGVPGLVQQKKATKVARNMAQVDFDSGRRTVNI